MFKHGLPEYIPPSLGIGDQYKVAITTHPREATALFAKDRVGNDAAADVADRWFLASLIALYGRRPFRRGNLDAGRLNRLFGREIVPAQEQSFDPTSFNAELRVDIEQASSFFSHMS
jgi:hypothetical protein